MKVTLHKIRSGKTVGKMDESIEAGSESAKHKLKSAEAKLVKQFYESNKSIPVGGLIAIPSLTRAQIDLLVRLGLREDFEFWHVGRLGQAAERLKNLGLLESQLSGGGGVNCYRATERGTIAASVLKNNK
jgi:hypothetical protein